MTAPDGKQARYTYDPAGRVVTTERDLNPSAGQPQVLVTYNRYDSADRIVSIAEVKRVDASDPRNLPSASLSNGKVIAMKASTAQRAENPIAMANA